MSRDPLDAAIHRGLDRAFSPGGGAFEVLGGAFEKAIAPMAEELKRLRQIEARYKWHSLEDAKPWVFDGRTMLLFRYGEMMFGHYVPADGDCPGYWDMDEEYGGEPIEPPPTHFYILRKSPTPEEQHSKKEGV